MSPRNRTRLARLVLVLGAVASLFWLSRLDYASKVSTDVLELMPADERDPDLAMVRSFASERQARVALFALEAANPEATDDGENLARAREAFVASLAGSGAFREVVSPGDPAYRDALGQFVFERRFDLLLPEWMEERHRAYVATGGRPDDDEGWKAWLARDVVQNLDTFLARPEATAFEALIPRDPLLLVPHLVESLQGMGSLDGGGSDNLELVWAEASQPPLREEGQAPVFAAVDNALAKARALVPSLQLRWTAVSRFAAESRDRIESELKGLNLVALLVVVVIVASVLRRAWQVLHLVPVIVGALLGAWTFTTLVFARVHILVFVIGTLLAGVAVDYGLHVFLHRSASGDDYAVRLRQVWRPLLGSAMTTLAGFALLASSGLPLLRQTGVFVCAGIVSAALISLLWFAQVPTLDAETRFDALDDDDHRPRLRRRHVFGVLMVAAITAVVGVSRLHWHDDVRELEVRSPELWQNDRDMRALFGESREHSVFLTRGAGVEEARSNLARFQAWIAGESPQARTASLGLVLPSPEALRKAPDHIRALRGFEAALRGELERRDFDADSFLPFFTAWRELAERREWPAFSELVDGFSRMLQGPASMAVHLGPGLAWFLVIVEDGPVARPPTETATVGAGQLETLNQLFGRYRLSALRLSVAGLGLAGASVVAMFGFRRGARMFIVPVGACLFVFGLLGIAGQTLNLFHLLGAFLAVCLTIDYAIFAGESRDASVPPSVRLSALTTIASFGVLGFSAIPVVSALGLSVAMIVTSGWILVEVLARVENRS